MANIPVERTGGGGGWWKWLLGLLILILLIWLIAELLGGEPDEDDFGVTQDTLGVVSPTDPGTTTPGVGDTLTTLEQVRTARRQGELYGKEVALSGVRATEVAADSTFFIQDPDASGDARLLVVLEELGEGEVWAPGPEGSDGRYNINEGETMTVRGRIDRFTGTEPQVTGQNRDRLAPDSLYINARQLRSEEDQVLAQ